MNIGLIDQTARYALDSRCGVILWRGRHFYFDIPFEQTVRRHATRPMAKEVTPEQTHQ